MKKKTDKKFFVLGIILFAGMIGITQIVQNSIETELLIIKAPVHSIDSIQTTDQVLIIGDPDFVAQASVEGWNLGGTRDGSASAPFLITGNTLTLGVSITNTTYHFELKTNAIIDGVIGISLRNVSNGKITDNIILESITEGIKVIECPGQIEISENNVTSTQMGSIGISIASSNGTLVSKNMIESNIGIQAQGSNSGGPCVNNTIVGNRISKADYFGIFLKGANNNTVKSNELSNTGFTGIYLYEDDSVIPARPKIHDNQIINNTITNSTQDGIYIQYSRDNILRNNSVINVNGYGIALEESQNDTLIGNTITKSLYGTGIRFFTTIETNMIENRLEDCYFVLVNSLGIEPGYYYQGEIRGNLVNGKPLIYWQNVHGGTVPTDASQVFIVNCTDIKVANLHIQKQHNSIVIASGSGLSIYNNTVEDCAYGLYLYSCKNNTIFQNNFSVRPLAGSYGIAMYSSDNNLIVNNYIDNFDPYGIYSNNAECNVILANTIKNSLNYGIYLTSTNNTIVMLNSLIDNKQALMQAFDDGTTNTFENNYWNDFISPDVSPPDGFVDGSYNISGGLNQDSFALTIPYSVTPPTIIFPNGGETLNDKIMIQWTIAGDIFDSTFTYDLYYSNNNGMTWQELATGLDTTSYEWPTLELPNSSSMLIRVWARSEFGMLIEDLSNDVFTVQNIGHSLSPPSITAPVGGETINGIINIQWLEATDSWGHTITVTYEIFYSDDEGSSWTLLSTLTANSFLWDTTIVEDGTTYQFKVVATSSDGLTSVAQVSLITIQNTNLLTTTTPTLPATSDTTTPQSTSTPGWMSIIIVLTLGMLTIWKRKYP